MSVSACGSYRRRVPARAGLSRVGEVEGLEDRRHEGPLHEDVTLRRLAACLSDFPQPSRASTGCGAPCPGCAGTARPSPARTAGCRSPRGIESRSPPPRDGGDPMREERSFPGSMRAASSSIRDDMRYALEVNEDRWSTLRSPAALGRAPRAASRGARGESAPSPIAPKSLEERTIPRPKWNCRRAPVRRDPARRGFPELAMERARASRLPLGPRARASRSSGTSRPGSGGVRLDLLSLVAGIPADEERVRGGSSPRGCHGHGVHQRHGALRVLDPFRISSLRLFACPESSSPPSGLPNDSRGP